MKPGPLKDADASRLLAAGTIADLMLLLFLTRLIGTEFMRLGMGGHAVLFVVLFLVYITLTEMLLAGRSPGRMCLRLQVRASDGSRLGWRARIARGWRRLATLGLGGLDLTRASWWDKKSGAVWASPMAPRPVTDWRLYVRNGESKGARFLLGEMPGWQGGDVKIGRDPRWADVALPKDTSVSGRHARLRLRDGKLQLCDCGTSGEGSSHGTFVGKQRIPPGRWVDISNEREFSVAGVRLIIDR